MAIFGIDDPGVILAYVLCFAGTILCIAYSAIYWNKGDEEDEEDAN